jgi:predicted nicotinamide N-methyase
MTGELIRFHQQVLSNYLAYKHANEPEYLEGKSIVELGSGTGLVGLVAGLLEPTARIWITDQE